MKDASTPSRYVGGESDGVTSVEVFTNGTLGGKVVFPDERNAETFQAIRRETFLLRGRTLADFINKTKTEKWKALVEILGLDAIESLREDLQRARNELRKLSKAAEEEVRTYRRALASGSEEVTDDTVLANLQQICAMLGVDPPAVSRSGGRSVLADRGGWRQCGRFGRSDRESLLAEIKTLSTPRLRPARCRSVERPRVLRSGAASAARLAGARGETPLRNRVDRQGTLPALRPDSRSTRPWRGESRARW